MSSETMANHKKARQAGWRQCGLGGLAIYIECSGMLPLMMDSRDLEEGRAGPADLCSKSAVGRNVMGLAHRRPGQAGSLYYCGL